jgi:hypothetical protein
MPSAKIHPEPVWKQLGYPSLHEQYQEKYGLSMSHNPYSGPRGHPQTLREEADQYKRAMREWRAHEYEMGEHMARCMKPRVTPIVTPKSNIQQPEVQAMLKPTKPKISMSWDKFVHKFFCIPHYELTNV